MAKMRFILAAVCVAGVVELGTMAQRTPDLVKRDDSSATGPSDSTLDAAWANKLTLLISNQENTANNISSSRALTAKANALFNEKRYDEAAEAYREALRLNPNNGEAQNGLASTYSVFNQYEEAIEAFKLGLRLNPNEAVAHSRLGEVYAELGRYKEAVASLKEAIRLDPEDYVAHYNLGVAYLHLGDRNAVLRSYEILKTLKPDLANRLYSSMDANPVILPPYKPSSQDDGAACILTVKGKPPVGLREFYGFELLPLPDPSAPSNQEYDGGLTTDVGGNVVFYEYSKLIITGRQINFTTVPIRGIKYEFTGQFTSVRITSAVEDSGEVVVEGVVTKYKSNRKVAEGNLQFTCRTPIDY